MRQCGSIADIWQLARSFEFSGAIIHCHGGAASAVAVDRHEHAEPGANMHRQRVLEGCHLIPWLLINLLLLGYTPLLEWTSFLEVLLKTLIS